MITKLRVKNFRGIADQEIHLDQMTVLVGQNAAGKSSIIDVLKFLRDALTQSLDLALLNRHTITSVRRWAPTKPYDIEITFLYEDRNSSGEYNLCIGSGKDGDFRIKHEFCKASYAKSRDTFERQGNQWITAPGSGTSSGHIRRPLDNNSLVLPAIAIFSPPSHAYEEQ